MKERYSALFQFFSGYFGQDWDSDHKDVPSAISAFIHDALESELRAVIIELRMFFDETAALSNEELESVLVREFNFYVEPKREVLQLILRQLEAGADKMDTPLTKQMGSDTN